MEDIEEPKEFSANPNTELPIDPSIPTETHLEVEPLPIIQQSEFSNINQREFSCLNPEANLLQSAEDYNSRYMKVSEKSSPAQMKSTSMPASIETMKRDKSSPIEQQQ